MGLTRESRSVKRSFVGRLSRAFDGALSRFSSKKDRDDAAARKRYLAAIDASPITPEQRRKAMENAAANVDIAALDEADHAYERFVKEQESGEFRRRRDASGHRST